MNWETLIAIFAIIISIGSLWISILVYRKNTSTRSREWRIEAKKMSEEIRLLLDGIPSQCDSVLPILNGMMSLAGATNSGRRELYENEIREKRVESSELREKLSDTMSDVDALCDEGLEEKIPKLHSLKLETQQIVDWLDSKKREYKTEMRKLAERRNAGL